MKNCIKLEDYTNVKILSDNLLVLYKNNHKRSVLVKRDSLEAIYPNLNIYGLITSENSDSIYHTYLTKENIALIEKKVENPTGIRINGNNKLCYNYCYEIMRTPIDLSTGKMLYENAWYQFWDYSQNFDNIIFVRGGDIFGYQILNKKDGTPLFPGLSFKYYEPCPKSQNRTYKLTRSDGMVTLFDTYTGKLVFGTTWFKACDYINKFSYVLTYEDNLKRIVQVYGDYKFHTDFLDECEKLNENTFKIRKFGEKYSTIINTEDFTQIFTNIYYYDWIDWSFSEYLVTREDGMKNVISKSDGKFVYDETTWFRKWKLLDKYYDKVQVTREDGLSSLLDKRTKKLSKDDVWYKDFRLFVDNTIIATNTDNLSTLIDGDTLEVIYPNLLFKEIHEFSDKYYLIIDKTGYKNLIRKSDGALVFDFYISPNKSKIIFLNENEFMIKEGDKLRIINTKS